MMMEKFDLMTLFLLTIAQVGVQVGMGGKQILEFSLACIISKIKTVFLSALTENYKLQTCIMHCQKQLRSEENRGKLQVPRFFWKTEGKHTYEE